MKKYVAAFLIFAVILSLAAFPARADALCFTAVNDMMYELSDSTMPAFVNGELYIPYSVLVNTSLNVGYIYDKTTKNFTLYHNGAKLAFDMAAGLAYDESGTSYEKQAVMRNSRIYVPAQFVCEILRLGYAYMADAQPCAIVRITNENAYLDTASFPGAASRTMNQYLEQYELAHPTQSVPPTVTVTRPAVNSGEVDVFLSFEGLSEHTPAMLDSLGEYRCRATFFITAEEIAENAALVRRIAGEGHSIGVKCADTEEYERAAALLFSAAKLKTVLISAPFGADEEKIGEAGLILWQHPEGNGVIEGDALSLAAIESRINERSKRADMRFSCSEETKNVLPAVISRLTSKGYNIKNITETDEPYVISGV